MLLQVSPRRRARPMPQVLLTPSAWLTSSGWLRSSAVVADAAVEGVVLRIALWSYGAGPKVRLTLVIRSEDESSAAASSRKYNRRTISSPGFAHQRWMSRQPTAKGCP